MKPDRPWHWTSSITVVLVLIIFIYVYLMNSAVKGVQQRHRAENYARMALIVVGVPTFIFQASIQLCLIAWCVWKMKDLDPTLRADWLLWLAILLPAVTLATIVVGNHLAIRWPFAGRNAGAPEV